MDSTVKAWAAIISFIVVVVVALGFLFSTFEQIEAGERGVVLSFGEYSRTLEPGFHMVIPFKEKIIVMDVRVQKYEVQADAASKDMQTIDSKIALNYHTDPSKLGELITEIGTDYEAKIIQPAIQESVKAGVALYTAEELISKRAEVSSFIKSDLNSRLNNSFMVVDEFSIVDFGFSDNFTDAIERKVTAEQDALTAENKLDQVQFEADQKVAIAQAEAESSRLQAEALKNGSEVIELRKAEALFEFAKNWGGVMPTSVTIMGDGGALPLFNVN